MARQRIQVADINRESLPTTAKNARALGSKYFFNGKPCGHGNVAPRYTAGNGCLCEPCCALRARRALEWRDRPGNYERHKESLAKHKASPHGKARIQAYNAENMARLSAQAKAWRYANPERNRANRKRWFDQRPELKKAHTKRRNATVIAAKPSWWSKWDVFVMQEAKDLARRRTQATGIEWERDHMVPLRGRVASGLHCAANIQVIPRVLNGRKSTRLELCEPGEWIQHI